MGGTARLLPPMTVIALVLFAALLGSDATVLGQETSTEGASSTPLRTTPEAPFDSASDRVTRIEQKLRQLEARNQRLRNNCDALSRQCQELLQQGADPVFGRHQGNSDGRGIPGALSFRPSAFWQQKRQSSGRNARPWTEERSAGEGDGDKEDSDEVESGQGVGRRWSGEEPEAGQDEEVETIGPAQLGLPVLTPYSQGSRRQSGIGGAGQRIERHPENTTAAYLESRGPYEPDMRPPRLPVEVYFGDGLDIRSTDEFFSLEFHNLTQLDYRAFDRTGDALHDNFIIPRQRWYFQGDLSPYAYYYTVIDRGYGSIDILDSFMDLNFAPKYKRQFQLRVGRMKTPFTYEYVKVSESDLIAAERSLFVTNFAGNREEGAMMHGQLFESSMEYFVGVFNGPRRSFQGYNNSKDIFSFFSFKPFLHGGPEWLRQLNVSGSVFGGYQRNPVQPANLVTANDQASSSAVPATLTVSPTFLIYNDKTFENGPRMQWAADVAYYYKSFTLLANYDGGFQTYSLEGTGTLPSAAVYEPFSTGAFVGVGSPHRTRVPLTGWSIACTYFLTGEQITRRVYLTEPRRPFGFYNGRLNPGAIEAYFRFANLQLGDQVFTGGIANPADWANRVSTTDTGINWYLNHYVRMYFDWQHAMYNREVFMSDTKSTRHNDLFWIRTQIFF